jgi:adenine-specific DNA-methyltransferase
MIKYIGSKRKLLKNILQIAKDVGVTSDSKILDAFSGSGNVSYALAQEFGSCDSCDLLKTSQCLNQLFLNESMLPNLDAGNQFVDNYFNQKERTIGYFYKTFSSLNKKPLSVGNLIRLDGYLQWIETFDSDTVKNRLKGLLIYAVDKVDNTLGHYSSYLRDPSKRSYNMLRLVEPTQKLFNTNSVSYHADILSNNVPNDYDFVYLDPPYGTNNLKMPSSRVRYGAYYHFLESLALNDSPDTFGKVGRRADSSDKLFHNPLESHSKELAFKSFEKIFAKFDRSICLLSYSNQGTLSIGELIDVASKTHTVTSVYSVPHKSNVMSNMVSTLDWCKDEKQVVEYLVVCHTNVT